MAEALSVAEAKRRFSELLDRVQRGERFVISRRGKPVVGLVHPDEVREAPSRPGGLLSIVGLLDDWRQEDVDEMVRHIYRERRRAKDRPAPDLG